MVYNAIFIKPNLQLRFPHPDFPGFENYNAFNNTIAQSIGKKEYILIFRYSNFTPTRDKKIPVLTAFNSKLGALIIDSSLQIVKPPFLIGGITPPVDADPCFCGYEDPRIFVFDQHYFILANHFFPGTQLNKMFLLHLDHQLECRKMIELISPFNAQPEKNWIPFVWNNELWIKYRLEPNILFQLDPVNGKMKSKPIKTIQTKNPVFPAEITISGGSPLIDYNPHEWIGIAHTSTFDEVDLHHPYFNPEKRQAAVNDTEYRLHFNTTCIRNFYSYIYTVSKKFPFRILKKSNPLKFVNPDGTYEDIQYAAGICPDFSGRYLIIAYGTNDQDMNILFLTMEQIEALMTAENS